MVPAQPRLRPDRHDSTARSAAAHGAARPQRRPATTPPRPARPRALLMLLVLTTTLLAGCHGLPHDPPPDPGASADTTDGDPQPPATPPPVGKNPLPAPHLDVTIDGPRATIVVSLDGDPAPIVAHTLQFGDASETLHGDGAPAQRYTHTYPTPPNFRHDDLTFHARLTLHSAQGHTESADAEIVMAAPPNRAPLAHLNVTRLAGAPPLPVIITMEGHDTDGTIESWRLDLGDGSAPVIGPGIPTRPYQHEYRTIGTHTIRLTLIDDQGHQGHSERDIHVWPPQDVRAWSIDTTTQRVHVQDGNGTTLNDYGVRRPTCGRATTCETPIDVATGAGRAYVVLERPQTNGTVWVLDATDGRGRYNVTVGLHPDAVWTDPAGHAWVTHATSGRVARIAATSHRAAFYETPLDNTSAKQVAFSADGRHAWILGRGQPALLVHIDPESRQVGTLTLPAGLEPVTVVHQNVHGSALVAGNDGRVLYVAWEAGIPVIQDIVDIGLGAGGSVTALACHGRDHCWVATSPGTDTDARIVRLPARPDPTGLATRTLESLVLPAPLNPTGLTARDDALVITIGGTGANGVLLADPAAVALTDWHVTNTTAPGGTDFSPHPTQPHLVYVDAPDLPGWRLIDTRTGRTVHEAALPFAADAFAIAPRSA